MTFLIGLALCRLIQISTFSCVYANDLSFALCADQKGFIHCEKGTKIRVKSAIYGRTDNKVCPGGNTNTRTCRSLTSEMKVKWNCNGYRTCHLHASNQIFGNPCKYVSKYLQVTYGCVKNPDGKDQIAFNAYNTATLSIDTNTHFNVVYNAVYYNHGNAYNPVSGFFTAPSPGLYVFTWASVVAPKKTFDAEILVNGKRKGLGNCYNGGGSGFENCSNTVPLILATGDKVNIRTDVADYLHGGGWSNFKGWKVY
uniref:Uncharacterized protein LOC111102473 n=1 Tax=Crassostrea virginica TaxID=6565 RepID=A0A8B8ALK3_CRAVI|nr:uncharacterized protein LOC111102473 [Crassostrea virginica]